MKIESFKFREVSVPVRFPVISSVRFSEEISFVTLEIQTNEGISGVSYAQSFNSQVAKGIFSILEFFENMMKGTDPLSTEARWREMWKKTLLFGHAGIVSFAISMVDVALWDVKGKYYNKPIYYLLGGEKKKYETYASDGLWLVNKNEALKQSEQFVKEGFQSVKMRMGRNDYKKDIEVLQALRTEWGDSLDIMADVNQGWTKHEAEDMIKELDSYNLYWLEEPIPTDALDNYAQLNKDSNIRICSGENIYGVNNIEQCVRQRTSSFFTPDLQRIGGVTGWLKLAPILELHRVPCTFHLFPEIAVHLLSIYPYTEKIEWMSWSSNLFKEPIKCENGTISPSDQPGFGLEFK